MFDGPQLTITPVRPHQSDLSSVETDGRALGQPPVRKRRRKNNQITKTDRSRMQTVKAEWVDDHERKEVEDWLQANTQKKSHNISFWCFDGPSEGNLSEPIDGTTRNHRTRKPDEPVLLEGDLLWNTRHINLLKDHSSAHGWPYTSEANV